MRHDMRMHTKFLLGYVKGIEIYHVEDLGMNGKVILEWILGK
jgi:hypothetical protein